MSQIVLIEALSSPNREFIYSVCVADIRIQTCEWIKGSTRMHVRRLLKDGLSTYTRRIHLDARVIYASEAAFVVGKLSVSRRVVNLTWRTYSYARRKHSQVYFLSYHAHRWSTNRCLVTQKMSMHFCTSSHYLHSITNCVERDYLHATTLINRSLKICKIKSRFIAYLKLRENFNLFARL